MIRKNSIWRACARVWRTPVGASGRAVVRRLAARSWSRAPLNHLHAILPSRLKSYCHICFAQIFRDSHGRVDEGQWWVKFAGKKIVLPLRPERISVDWDGALSILGCDFPIKDTYRAFLGSSLRPELFVDVGGNLGTHSLLFLVHGVDTLTFEPNDECHAYLAEFCRMNGVTPTLETVALGATEGEIELCYPVDQSWLGTTDAATRGHLEAKFPLKRKTVRLARLDDYLRHEERRMLIKIDTEGNESSVLKGAEETLRDARPTVIFESNDPSRRAELSGQFKSLGYEIAELPCSPIQSPRVIDEATFVRHGSNNFIALPCTGEQDEPE